MNTRDKRKNFVISLGGSNICPTGEINIKFLMKLNTFIRDYLNGHPKSRFFLVVGGGGAATKYRDAGRQVLGQELKHDDLDWLGIHVTRLNAHLVRTVFHDIAHPTIIDDYTIIRKPKEHIVVAAGWRPGWSTDYCATLICEDYHVDTILNLSNVPYVFDKDPNKYTNAVPIEQMTWKEYRALAGNEWNANIHVPFDPIAAKKAEELKIKVVVMSDDFKNMANYFNEKEFIGTTIS